MSGIVRISEGSNLAIHALAYLAHKHSSEALTVATIAKELGVSKDHLGKVMQRLTRQGFVYSKRGPRGGFTPARQPSEVTLLEIIEAVEGPLNSRRCMLGNPICQKKRCLISDLTQRIYDDVHQELSSSRLEDLLPMFDETPDADSS